MIKLVVTDMDGTFLNHEKNIENDNYNAIMECHKKGIKVALASGRSVDNLYKYADQLKINDYNGYLVGNNGQEVFFYEDFKKEKGAKVPNKVCREVMKIFDKYNVYVYAFANDQRYGYIKESYKENIKNPKVRLKSYGYNEESKFFDFNEGFDKFGCYSEEINVFQIYQEIEKNVEGDFNLFMVNANVVELVGKGVDKVNGIKKIQDKLNLKDDEILTFGDGFNDLQMLKKYHGVAMSNALEKVKEEVEYTVDNSKCTGVAEGINKFILKR